MASDYQTIIRKKKLLRIVIIQSFLRFPEVFHPRIPEASETYSRDFVRSKHQNLDDLIDFLIIISVYDKKKANIAFVF